MKRIMVDSTVAYGILHSLRLTTNSHIRKEIHMTTKTATKTKMTKVPTTLHGKMDRIQEMIEFLSNDITDGTITNNEITDQLEEITTKIENFKELL